MQQTPDSREVVNPGGPLTKIVLAGVTLDKTDLSFRVNGPENDGAESLQVMMMMSEEMVTYLGPSVKPYVPTA